MKRVRIAFVLLLVIISGSWLIADSLIPDPFNYFSFRSVFVQFSGVLGIGMMSVAMFLAYARDGWSHILEV